MNVKLDWQFKEDEFEDLERPSPAHDGRAVAMQAPSYPTVVRDPERWRVGSANGPESRANPGRPYLIVSLILFCCLVLLCILV
jgi:hypothetical protein